MDIGQKNGALTRTMLEPVKSIKVVDKYTVKWYFKKPWGGFMGIMQSVPGFSISANALKGDVAFRGKSKIASSLKIAKKKLARAERKGKASKITKAKKKVATLEKEFAQAEKDAKGAIPLDTHAVGSGPYMVEEARPGNYLKLKKNPNWWFGKSIGRPDMPYFDGKKIIVIPDISVQLANLRARKIDMMDVDPSQYKLIKNDSSLRVYVTPQNHVRGLLFNHASKKLKDIRVRKAISHVIDRKAIVNGVLFGLGREASCMYPGDHWGHNPRLKPENMILSSQKNFWRRPDIRMDSILRVIGEIHPLKLALQKHLRPC